MKTLGQVAYEAVSPYGVPWSELSSHVRENWERLAVVVPKAVREHQQSQYDELDTPK